MRLFGLGPATAQHAQQALLHHSSYARSTSPAASAACPQVQTADPSGAESAPPPQPACSQPWVGCSADSAHHPHNQQHASPSCACYCHCCCHYHCCCCCCCLCCGVADPAARCRCCCGALHQQPADASALAQQHRAGHLPSAALVAAAGLACGFHLPAGAQALSLLLLHGLWPRRSGTAMQQSRCRGHVSTCLNRTRHNSCPCHCCCGLQESPALGNPSCCGCCGYLARHCCCCQPAQHRLSHAGAAGVQQGRPEVSPCPAPPHMRLRHPPHCCWLQGLREVLCHCCYV